VADTLPSLLADPGAADLGAKFNDICNFSHSNMTKGYVFDRKHEEKLPATI
jgi:hypothetical protein